MASMPFAVAGNTDAIVGYHHQYSKRYAFYVKKYRTMDAAERLQKLTSIDWH